jgi:regulator of replication initiation timing
MNATEPLHDSSMFHSQLGFSSDPLYQGTLFKTFAQPEEIATGTGTGTAAAPVDLLQVKPPPPPPPPESTFSRMSSDHRPTFYIPHDNSGEESNPENVKYIRAMYKELFFETKLSGPLGSYIISVSDVIFILTEQYRENGLKYTYTFSIDGDGDAASMLVVNIHLEFTLGEGRKPIVEDHTLCFRRFLTSAEKKLKKESAKYDSDCQKYTQSICDLKRQLAELQQSIGETNSTIETLQSENKRLRTEKDHLQNSFTQLQSTHNDTLLVCQSALTNAKLLCENLIIFQTKPNDQQ